MKIHNFEEKNISGSLITRENERQMSALLTIRMHEKNSAEMEALLLLYTEMLFAGSGTLTRHQFLDALADLGSEISLVSNSHGICFTIVSLDVHIEKTLKLFRTLITEPRFIPAELIRIKEYASNVLSNEKENAKREAQHQFIRLMVRKSDPRFHYKIDEIKREIELVKISDLKSLHTTLSNYEWVLTIGGSEAGATAVERYLTNLRHRMGGDVSTPNYENSISPYKTHSFAYINIPNKQNIECSIGNTVPIHRNDPEFPALFLGMSVLGLYGGFAGRLMSTVREKEGLTYSIYGQIEGVTHYTSGYWRVATFFNPNDFLKGILSTKKQIELLYKDGITKDELHRFKNILTTRFALTDDSLIKKVREQHTRSEGGITENNFLQFKQNLLQVNCADVHTAVQKFINPSALVISCAGPTKGLEKKLEDAL